MLEEQPLEITLAVDSEDDEGPQPDSADATDDPTVELRFSATEVLRHKDFADYSPTSCWKRNSLMSRLRFVGAPRRSMRLAAAEVRTDTPDLRRTVKGGDARRRRADAAALPHAHHAQSPAGAAARRERLDGALRGR